jgi:hypothetical protein
MDSKKVQIRLEPPSGRTLAYLDHLLNYTWACQGFWGYYEGK